MCDVTDGMKASENAELHSIISGGGELELVGEVQLGQRLEDVGHTVTKLDLVDGVGGRPPHGARGARHLLGGGLVQRVLQGGELMVRKVSHVQELNTILILFSWVHRHVCKVESTQSEIIVTQILLDRSNFREGFVNNVKFHTCFS